jgi:hypothetical protein
MERTMVVVPEKKEAIDNIKAKYNSLQRDDKTAGKIFSLDAYNSILVGAAEVSSISAVVDVVVPDPANRLDEASLAALTELLKYPSSLVENKMEELAASENSKLKVEETGILAKEMRKCAKAISALKQKRATK